MTQQTIEQRRAAFALKQVQDAKRRGVNAGEFRSYAKALPAMIHMNGLGQASAFCRAKGQTSSGKTYGELYQVLSRWLTSNGQPLAGNDDLLEGITLKDMYRYRVAQAEALALMEWVRKFAVAFMPEDKEAADEAG